MLYTTVNGGFVHKSTHSLSTEGEEEKHADREALLSYTAKPFYYTLP